MDKRIKVDEYIANAKKWQDEFTILYGTSIRKIA